MYTTTMFLGRVVRLVAVAAVLMLGLSATAWGQDDPNTGAVTFTGGLDVLPGSAYVFRGLTQEAEPRLTLWPYGDIGFALGSGEGGVKNVSLNFGVWNSLHTGSSGSGEDGPGYMHYEEDFYTTLTLGLVRGYTVATTYTAYTSPNRSFDTVNEVAFKVSRAHKLVPYGTLAFEIGDGSADGGKAGTYLEVGIGPVYPLGASQATLTIPVKLGLSLNNYYEYPTFGKDLTEVGKDKKFGFFDVGALVMIPLGGVPSSFGKWNLHGGFDIFLLGDTTEVFNKYNNVKFTGQFGIGLTY